MFAEHMFFTTNSHNRTYVRKKFPSFIYKKNKAHMYEHMFDNWIGKKNICSSDDLN